MLKFTSPLLTLCLCTTAMAASTAYEGKTLGFNDMKMACQSPAKFHNQMAPESIQISCHDVRTIDKANEILGRDNNIEENELLVNQIMMRHDNQ